VPSVKSVMVLIKLNTIERWHSVARLILKLNLPDLKLRKENPILIYLSVSTKGDHHADSYDCSFWEHRFNREWHIKKSQELREIRTNLICLTIDRSKQ